jgi:hypothetical protein
VNDTVPYIQKLQHPKWQKRRLEAFEAAGFRCSHCKSEEQQLHIHHGYYAKGKEPWEADDAHLHVYCSTCHKVAEEIKRELLSKLGTFNTLRMSAVFRLVNDIETFCEDDAHAITISVRLKKHHDLIFGGPHDDPFDQ